MCLSRIILQKNKNGKFYQHYDTRNDAFIKNNKFCNFTHAFLGTRDRDLHRCKHDDKKEYVGYKLFKKHNLSSHYIASFDFNKWMQATCATEKDNKGIMYTTGFHILYSREDARKFKETLFDPSIWQIYKVLYKDIIGYGIDGKLDNAKVVLSRYMKVLDEKVS